MLCQSCQWRTLTDPVCPPGLLSQQLTLLPQSLRNLQQHIGCVMLMYTARHQRDYPDRTRLYVNWPGSMTLWMGGGRGASWRVTCSRSNTSSLWLEGATKEAWETNQRFSVSPLILKLGLQWVSMQTDLCESMCGHHRGLLLRNGEGRWRHRYTRVCWDSVQVAKTNPTTQTRSKKLNQLKPVIH